MRRRILLYAYKLMAVGNLFAGHLLINAAVEPSEATPTATLVDGVTLINETWAETLTDKQLAGVVIHEYLGKPKSPA